MQYVFAQIIIIYWCSLLIHTWLQYLLSSPPPPDWFAVAKITATCWNCYDLNYEYKSLLPCRGNRTKPWNLDEQRCMYIVCSVHTLRETGSASMKKKCQVIKRANWRLHFVDPFLCDKLRIPRDVYFNYLLFTQAQPLLADYRLFASIDQGIDQLWRWYSVHWR